MDEMNIPSIILLALIVIALVLVIIHIIRNGGCSGDCSACKGCNNCSNCKKGGKKQKVKHIPKGRAAALPFRLSKNLYFSEKGVAGAKPPTGTRGGSTSKIAPSHGEGAWG